MDFRRFLNRHEEIVVPYLGGPEIVAPGRGLRVASRPAPGWWRFSITGRTATPVAPVPPPGQVLEGLPSVRGHLWAGHLAREDAVTEAVHLLPDDEPPRFSPCRARRWHSGHLIFDRLEWEQEAEEGARRALEQRRALAVKGVPASLRAAFGYALAEAMARERAVRVSPLEIRQRVLDIADGGAEAAEQELRRLETERERGRREAEASRRRRQAPAPATRGEDGRARAANALRVAGAEPLDLRGLAGGLLEVTYRFQGERFLTVVDAATLRVVDAGICLAGADQLLTLESLPAAIREAIDSGSLVITRGECD